MIYATRMLLFLSGLLTYWGCVSIHIPDYVPDVYSYKMTYPVSYPQALAAVEEVLAQEGWLVSSRMDPAIFEHDKNQLREGTEQILLLTELRQTSRFIYSRYYKINIYLT